MKVNTLVETNSRFFPAFFGMRKKTAANMTIRGG
jgi:hypothetical protein